MKVINILSKLKRSLFFKLLLVFVVTMLAINAIAAVFFQSHVNVRVRDTLSANIQKYIEYIATDLGSPPDTLLARTFSDMYQLEIRYENDEVVWSTADTQIENSLFTNQRFQKQRGWLGSRVFMVSLDDGSRYYFWTNFHSLTSDHKIRLISFLVVLSFIITLSFLSIRKIFKPINYLTEGVKAVGGGKLGHHIPVQSGDELGVLSESFNTMTERIKNMLEARDQLLSDVSHELRSPITRMKVALELMEDGKHKSKLQDDLHEMETMITELLETQRLSNDQDGLKTEKADLAVLTKSVIQEFEASDSRLSFETDLEQALLEIDPARIRMVIRNVIENALKYCDPVKGRVVLHLAKTPEYYEIRIRDNGPGIPELHLKNIFEPFYRADPSRSKNTGGYGLGLSISKKIVEAHTGSISIKNNSGPGLTVLVKLPRNS